MIAKEFENLLLQQKTLFNTGENLAVLIDTHNADHAILLLESNDISHSTGSDRSEKVWPGTISLTDILSYQMQHEIPDEGVCL